MSIDVNVTNDLVIVTETTEDIVVNVSNAAGPQGPAGANGVGVPVGGTTGQVLKKFTNTNYDTYWAADASGLTSVGLSMPSAFAVSNSPLTSNGTLAVTGAGTSAQYVRGDGQLANFPTNGGGGSSVNYYLNGSVTQGTFGGDTYYEMSKTPVLGAGTDFTRTNAQGNGYITSFITDAGDPSLLNIPAGNWNLEFYFQSSASGGSPQFYGEIYKVSSSNVFTLVASGSTNPEGITNGTTVDQYFTSIPVPQTSLLVTDRLAVRIYVIPDGRTITLHTENSNLCEVLTTLSTGLNALNGLTSQVQYFATGTSGTDFAISSATDTHTFNLPTASATNRGALSSADWSTFSGKVGGSGATGQVAYWNGTSSQTGSNNLFWDAANARLGIGTNTPSRKLHVIGTSALFQNAGAFELDLLNTTSGNYLRATAGATDANIGTIQNIPFSFIMNGARVGQFTSTNGNLILQNGGTFTDSGQRLQVQGTALITGNTGISAGNLSIFTTNTPRRINLEVANGSKAAAIGIQTLGVIHSVIGVDTSGTDFLQVASKTGISFYSGSTIGNIVTDPTNERMRLTTAGRLLLGTATESTFLLDVNGTARVSGDLFGSSNFLNRTNSGGYYSGTSDNFGFWYTGSVGNISLANAQPIVFSTANQERLRITSGGNLLVGTTTDVASSKVTIESTTQGFLPPRMTNAQRTAISSPAVGLIVYCTDATEGLYQYTSAGWANLNGVVTNRQTASYTLALTDINDLVEMNVATANNLTVPLNSSVAFPIGTKIDVAQYGAGQTTVVATGGVTVRSAGGALKLAVQYSGASLVKIGTDEWYLFGDITV